MTPGNNMIVGLVGLAAAYSVGKFVGATKVVLGIIKHIENEKEKENNEKEND